MNHIMLDIETMGTRSNAAILSIGAVKFDLDNPELGDEFYEIVKLQSCLDLGLSVDGSTIGFWVQQSVDARRIFDLPGAELPAVLISLRDFILYPQFKPDDVYIWGNGSTFDNVIVKNAYQACRLEYPVPYRNDMCYRTLRFLYKLKFPGNEPKYDKPHNAIIDAKAQAQKLTEMWSKMK